MKAVLVRDSASKPLTIWYPPDPSEVYVMGVDTAAGGGAKDGDDSAAIVLRASTLQEVASYRSNSKIPQEFAENVAALGLHYKGRAPTWCFTVCEAGLHGDVLMEVLRSRWRHTALYAERRGRDFTPGFAVQWGWKSLKQSKSDLVDAAREKWKEVATADYIQRYGPPIRTKALTEQIPKFVYDEQDRPTSSKKRGHDDLVIAYCLAILGQQEALRRVMPVAKVEPEWTYERQVNAWRAQKIDEANRRIGIRDWRLAQRESRELEALRNDWSGE